MKLLVTSDLHLSDRIWRHRPIEGDSYHSWNQVQELAIEYECDAVILAGDILDKQVNTSRPPLELVTGLKNLAENNIAVYYNQGQHELQSAPWMSLNSEAVWLHQQSLETPEGWFIAGCDYQNELGLQTFLQSPDALNADILVCHQVWLDFMGEMCKPQGQFADIPENVRYLITGDYHESICQKFGQLTVISPGSTHLRSISEPEDKFVYFMELGETTTKAKIVSFPLSTRRRILIDASNWQAEAKQLKSAIAGHLDAAEEYAFHHSLPKQLQKPLLRLTYDQHEAKLAQQVQKWFGDKVHLFYKQVKSTAVSNEPELNKHTDATDRVDMLNCLENYVDKQQNPLTYTLATTLLNAPDPEQALHNWIKEQVSDA